MTGGKGWTLSKKLGSLALTVWEWKGFEGKGSVSEWNNHEDVCRTALATPGLLNIYTTLQTSHSDTKCTMY